MQDQSDKEYKDPYDAPYDDTDSEIESEGLANVERASKPYQRPLPLKVGEIFDKIPKSKTGDDHMAYIFTHNSYGEDVKNIINGSIYHAVSSAGAVVIAGVDIDDKEYLFISDFQVGIKDVNDMDNDLWDARDDHASHTISEQFFKSCQALDYAQRKADKLILTGVNSRSMEFTALMPSYEQKDRIHIKGKIKAPYLGKRDIDLKFGGKVMVKTKTTQAVNISYDLMRYQSEIRQACLHTEDLNNHLPEQIRGQLISLNALNEMGLLLIKRVDF